MEVQQVAKSPLHRLGVMYFTVGSIVSVAVCVLTFLAQG